MTEYGYFLSCEQFTPDELIAQARRAQQAGFTRLAISDHFHFHPWNDAQGNGAFVWSMIGALNVHAYADRGHGAKDMPKRAGPALVTLNGRKSHSHRPHHVLDCDRSKTWRSSGGRAR